MEEVRRWVNRTSRNDWGRPALWKQSSFSPYYADDFYLKKYLILVSNIEHGRANWTSKQNSLHAYIEVIFNELAILLSTRNQCLSSASPVKCVDNIYRIYAWPLYRSQLRLHIIRNGLVLIATPHMETQLQRQWHSIMADFYFSNTQLWFSTGTEQFDWGQKTMN